MPGSWRFMRRKENGVLVKNHVHPITVVCHEDENVGESLASLRRKKHEVKILYFYVVDRDHRLKGVVSTRSLLLAEPEERIEDIMEKVVFSLKEDECFEKAIESLSLHRLLALPVVDAENRLKGIVDVQMFLEENIDLFKEQRSQDVFQLIGMKLEEGAHASPIKSYSKRMPWILCNMIGGVACAVVSFVFQVVLAKVLILAMFIPLVLALSESISMQSMTQSFQILRKQNVSMRKVAFQMFSEFRVALLMSITSGLLVGGISVFWNVACPVSTVIAVGIMLSVTFSAVVGASVPLLLHLSKMDPRVASGPVVLTIADIITTGIYLSIASWWLL